MIKKPYAVIKSVSKEAFEKEAEKLIKTGYLPKGGLHIAGNGTFVQAFLHRDVTEEKIVIESKPVDIAHLVGKEKIPNKVDELGLAMADSSHQWSDAEKRYFNSATKRMDKLEHHHTTTVGLWATDKPEKIPADIKEKYFFEITGIE